MSPTIFYPFLLISYLWFVMSVPVYSWSGVYRGGVSFCLSCWIRTVQETGLKALAYLNSFVLLKYFPLKPLVMSFTVTQF